MTDLEKWKQFLDDMHIVYQVREYEDIIRLKIHPGHIKASEKKEFLAINIIFTLSCEFKHFETIKCDRNV